MKSPLYVITFNTPDGYFYLKSTHYSASKGETLYDGTPKLKEVQRYSVEMAKEQAEKLQDLSLRGLLPFGDIAYISEVVH